MRLSSEFFSWKTSLHVENTTTKMVFQTQKTYRFGLNNEDKRKILLPITLYSGKYIHLLLPPKNIHDELNK